jgi:hypothetical protein
VGSKEGDKVTNVFCGVLNSLFRRISIEPGAIAVVFAAAVALSSPSVALAQRLEFEVASVKHSPNVGPVGGGPRRSGNRFTMSHAQISSIIFYAYNLHANYELVGDLGYGSDEWNSFDIDALVGQDANDDQVRLMLQALLADRFKLKLHRETRELPGYEVTTPRVAQS